MVMIYDYNIDQDKFHFEFSLFPPSSIHVTFSGQSKLSCKLDKINEKEIKTLKIKIKFWTKANTKFTFNNHRRHTKCFPNSRVLFGVSFMYVSLYPSSMTLHPSHFILQPTTGKFESVFNQAQPNSTSNVVGSDKVT